MDCADLVGEACAGMIRAFDKYEPDRGLRFITYAAFWMRASIHEYIMENYRLVNVRSRMRSDVFFRLRKTLVKALAEYCGDRAEAVAKTAKELGWTESEVNEYYSYITVGDAYLSSRVPGTDHLIMEDLMPSHRPSAEELYEVAEAQADARRVIERILPQLTEREQEILRLRYLCDEEDTVNLIDISQKWGISRERVRQIEAALFGRLYTHLDSGTPVRRRNEMRYRAAMENAPHRVRPKIRRHQGVETERLIRVSSPTDEAQPLAATG
jgi:RNA polymerase sigma-32 factor